MIRMRVTKGVHSFHPRCLQILGVGLAVCGVLAGCADATKGTFQTRSGYEETFKAAQDAMRPIGYALEQTDIDAGIVAGERPDLVRWYGRTSDPVRITVRVKRRQPGAELEIVVMPPKFVYGSTNVILQSYVYALQSRLADLTKVSTRTG